MDFLSAFFVDAESSQLQACRSCGARWVELHTGRYAEASWDQQPQELARLQEGTALARQLGLRVNAGHGLTYQNVEPIAAIPGMEELNIGHTIVARAVVVGLQQAVREMRTLIQNPRLDPLSDKRSMTTYHFIAASERFLTVEEPLEEVLRERRRNYDETGKTIDFWLLRQLGLSLRSRACCPRRADSTTSCCCGVHGSNVHHVSEAAA